MTVLITAASRRVGLVQAFRAALRAEGFRGRVIVTDVNPLSPAVHVADAAFRVPLATDPGYMPALLSLCETEQVGLVIPTIDDELAMFGTAREAFAAIGTFAACSPEATAELCNDKYATCRYLAGQGVDAAASWLPAELSAGQTLPLFIKPRVGRGAVGAFPVQTQRELSFFLDYVHDPVVQEYLSGPEYTIDVLCTALGQPLSIVPRERAVIRAGVIDRGRTVNLPSLIRLAQQVCAVLPFAGPINIQCRMRGETPVVFEINPRFSGGIPLTIAAGADFPAMLVRMAAGRAVEPSIGTFRDNLWMTSYESSVFLDSAEAGLREIAAQPAVPEGV